METRPGDPMHGDFARGGKTLPRDERPPRSQTAKSESHDERPGSFAVGWETKRRDGFRATVGHGRRRRMRA